RSPDRFEKQAGLELRSLPAERPAGRGLDRTALGHVGLVFTPRLAVVAGPVHLRGSTLEGDVIPLSLRTGRSKGGRLIVVLRPGFVHCYAHAEESTTLNNELDERSALEAEGFTCFFIERGEIVPEEEDEGA